jgi:coenzyme F420-0:L-glutamate ligase / coenzyme F420-1:gamma-L-glutamate ligase
MNESLVITPLLGIPYICAGDDLVKLIQDALERGSIHLQDEDILILAQKIVSKAEGRMVNLTQVSPSSKAVELSDATGKDARLVELILQESREVLRTRPGLIIVEHKLGYVCANAGIDHSNVNGEWGNAEDWVLLLPENPDKSAGHIREHIERINGARVGVMVIDTHGRAWRNGAVGVAIGLSGLPGLVDLRGHSDLFGYQLRATQVAAADELAGAASLVMGQAAESIPVVHVRGFPYNLRESNINELVRPKEKDLFR